MALQTGTKEIWQIRMAGCVPGKIFSGDASDSSKEVNGTDTHPYRSYPGHGGGSQERILFWQPGRDHRMPTFDLRFHCHGEMDLRIRPGPSQEAEALETDHRASGHAEDPSGGVILRRLAEGARGRRS